LQNDPDAMDEYEPLDPSLESQLRPVTDQMTIEKLENISM
jgi:hypothetical protein